jgi:hypothetical protein
MTTVNVELAGRFKLVATNSKTGATRLLADWFDNLIVNQGLNRIGVTSSQLFENCMVGSGTTSPVATQVSLTNQIASTNTKSVADVSGVDPSGVEYSYIRRTFRFPAGSATGNLTEVGVGWNSTAIFSRTLIKDQNGQPTSIQVLSDEFLDVLYEFRIYAPGDINGTVDISGTSYAYTIRPRDFNASSASSGSVYARWAGGVVSFYAGTVVQGGGQVAYSTNTLVPISSDFSTTLLGAETSHVNGTYVADSFERSHTTVFGLTPVTAAIGGLALTGSIGKWQVVFPVKIPKSSSNVFTLNWKTTWARRVI